MDYCRIKNWGDFQHYKDRSPPWIKLHREILNSQTWVALDDASRVLAVAIMLIASETDNRIPLNPAFIRRRAFLNSDPDFEPLFDCDFIELCEPKNQTLAGASTGLQNASASPSPSVGISPKKKKKTSKRRAKTDMPEDFGISEGVKAWAETKGHSNLEAHLESFRAKCEAHGYQYRNWDAAFQTAVREDWAGLTKHKGSSESDKWLRGCQ